MSPYPPKFIRGNIGKNDLLNFNIINKVTISIKNIPTYYTFKIEKGCLIWVKDQNVVKEKKII